MFDRRHILRGIFPWRFLEREHGSELIEVALVMPVFLMLVFGFINFMMILFGVCNMNYAVIAAARYGCMHSSTSMAPASMTDFNNIINPFLFNYPSNTHTTSVTYYGGASNTVGTNIYVLVSSTYNIVVPGFTYNALTLKANGACRVNQ